MGLMDKFMDKIFGESNSQTPSDRLLIESNFRLTNMNYSFFSVYQNQIDNLIKNQNQLIEENRQMKEFLKEKFPNE